MGRLLGLDYGEKRVGLAVTDELQMLSSPFQVLPRDARFWDKLKEIHQLYRFEKAIVGYPFSETYTDAMKGARKFGTQVEKELGIPVEYQNEENTTVYAQTLLKTMGKSRDKIAAEIDKFAAQKILSDYLNSKKA